MSARLLAQAAPPPCPAQICVVTTEAELRDALSPGGSVFATAGDTILFANAITLTSDLPSVSISGITISGGGFALDGAGQFRGFFIAGLGSPISVTVQDITIQNTIAAGGAGGSGLAGGGGGAGLGGAIFVGDLATLTISNVNISGSSAIGGAGGAGGVAGAAGGGGGGLGGAGGAGISGAGGGGGGIGTTATGGGGNGGVGIYLFASTGGNTPSASGGALAGGGAGGVTGASGANGGAGGGDDGIDAFGLNGGDGGFGGGGGGAIGPASDGGNGAFGGGGGATDASRAGGVGGFGGGGGGSMSGTTQTAAGGAFGGSGGSFSSGGGGGGGAALGGAIFVQSGGTLNIVGAFNVAGGSASGGAGKSGGTGGSAYGSGLFLGGSGTLLVNPGAGQSVNIANDIADTTGTIGGSGNSWSLLKSGAGTMTLSGNNAYSGDTFISGGTLSVASDSNLGVGPGVLMSANTTLQITGTSTFAKALGVAGLSTISVSPGQTATWTGVVGNSDTPAVLNVNGGGTLVLTNALNQYPSGTIVTGNTELVASSDGALGFGSASIALGDASTSGILGIPTSGFVSPRGISLGLGGGTIDVFASADATLSGSIAGGGSLTKGGAGTLTLSGTNSYSGGTLVNAGTLIAGSAGAFGSSGSLFVNGGASVDLNGFSVAFPSISGTGGLGLNGGAILTLGSGNSSSTFSGGITGTGGIIKNGTGTLSLFGTNTFSGGVTLNGGSLGLESSANLGAGALRMANGTSVSVSSGGTFANALSIAGLSTLTTGAGQTVTWNGAIANNGGAGTLNLTGGGTFALGNAANSYSGGTIVTGNTTLAVSNDGALGVGSLQLGDASSSATLAINGGTFLSSRTIVIGGLGAIIDTAGGTTAQLNGSLSGGNITKTGAGTLTLAGSNSTGALTVTGGTIRAGGSNVFSPGVLSLGGGTTADLNGFNQTIGSLNGTGALLLGGGAFLALGGDGSNSIFGGAISGTGGLIKNGGGLLSLNANNTFTGGIQLNGGTLSGNSSSLPGNILNNATVVFEQGSDGTYAGSMSGSGAVIKNGAGVLTFGSSNSYGGGTLINAGGLLGNTNSLQGLIINNSALTFNQTFDALFNGFITGTGTVTKLGSGNLTFGNTNAFTGLLTVGQGTLTLNNSSLPGSVSVGTQGTLAGTGTIGGNLSLAGSLLLPGITQATAAAAGFTGFNSFRTAAILPFATRDLPAMVINGDLIATQGSTMDFTVAAAGAAPVLVNGRASLIGTHLNVTIDDPNPSRTATYTAIKAVGGLTATGADVTTASTSILPVLTRAQNSLLVTVLNLRVPTTGIATTPNAVAAARGIDVVKQCTAGDLCDVVKEVLTLNGTELDDALTSLAGEIHASTLRVLVNDSRVMTDLVRNELSDAEHELEDANRVGWSARRPWLEFTGEHASFGTSQFSGGTANVGGSGGGMDFKPSGSWLAGFGAAFSIGGLSLSDISGKSTLKAPRAFGYTGVKFGPFHLHGGSSVAKNNENTKRDVNIHARVPDENGNLVPLSNGIDRNAESDQSGYTQDAWTELQHTKKWENWTADSKGGYRETRFVRRPFKETGAGAISLDAFEDVLRTHEAHVDLKAFKRTGAWRPLIVLNYLRQLGDNSTFADVNFQQRPESQFQVNGIPIPRDMFHGLFGLTMRTLSGLQYTFEYETTQASNESHNAVHFRMGFK